MAANHLGKENFCLEADAAESPSLRHCLLGLNCTGKQVITSYFYDLKEKEFFCKR